MKEFYEIIKPWILPIVAMGVILVLVISWNHSRNRERDLEQQLDRAKLVAAGIAAAAEESARNLRADLESMTQRSKVLADELTKLKKATPGATPTVLVSGTTGALPAGGVAPPSAAGQDGQVPPQAGGVSEGVCAPCTLHPGDPLELRVDVVAERTPSGVVAVVGVASAWTQGVKLVEGPLKLDVKMIEQARPVGWGAGAIIVGGRDGWWVGPLLALPPAHILGLEINGLLGGGVGGGGSWGGAAGAFARW